MRSLMTIVPATTLLLATPAEARDEKAWGSAGDIGRDALVVAALGIPAAQGDWKGDVQAIGSVGAAFLATQALKRTFPEERPDSSDRHSFPSGHSSVSFAAAATLQNRYGWKVGLPAQLVAGFVGLSRVEARKHHWYDVVVGAGIGEAAGFLITSKRTESVRVLPWGDTNSGGVSLSMRF